jgi:phage gp37-like protein
MKSIRWFAVGVAAVALFIGGVARADDTVTPANWDGLVEVKGKRMDMVFVAPGADFRPYTKILLDRTEVAFDKDWQKNMNDTRSVSRKIDDAEAAKIMEAASSNFTDVWTKALEKAGYKVATAPGPDVLRLSPAITNLYINAPDTMEAGRVTSYTTEAGEATLVLEVRDSRTNAMLGRVVDRRETRSTATMQQASRVTNRADFRMLFQQWASIAGKGLDELKELSPIPENLTPGQKLK